ncbi:hypothetical protein FD754_005670 [Muntiacus muntjak]|uniref:Peptidase S1 domain-containing protein n=1 Tax=Muntiacus muntjak TaxID=9888 RepID=A0A5N3WJ72_MUNMU|nr:hypothetical protein FD754_005670 [Muntiacus muntjak]
MAAALTGPHTVPGEPWPTTLSLLLLLFLLPPTQVVATAHRHPASEEVAFSRDVACGQRPVQGKILGGVDALERKWPWQVSVHYTGLHICGGSIVDEYWILSAAHCFDRSMNTEAYDIYVGLVDLLVAGNHTQWFEVNRVIIHPTYGLYHPIGGDVALVQLKTRIVFSDAVLPVCIAPPDLTLANLSCWATGWGSISQEEPLVEMLLGLFFLFFVLIEMLLIAYYCILLLPGEFHGQGSLMGYSPWDCKESDMI